MLRIVQNENVKSAGWWASKSSLKMIDGFSYGKFSPLILYGDCEDYNDGFTGWIALIPSVDHNAKDWGRLARTGGWT